MLWSSSVKSERVLAAMGCLCDSNTCREHEGIVRWLCACQTFLQLAQAKDSAVCNKLHLVQQRRDWRSLAVVQTLDRVPFLVLHVVQVICGWTPSVQVLRSKLWFCFCAVHGPRDPVVVVTLTNRDNAAGPLRRNKTCQHQQR